jgi:NADH-quinone oxidoreductase subunit H
MALASVLLLWAVIPFAPTLVGADLNVGVLFLVAVGSFGILSILMAGWSSNNKYALLGAFRVVAQLVSYEIPMMMAILVAVLLARSMGGHAIVEAQGVWFVVIAPLAAVIFFISNMAEVGRAPFDLLEADSEIVAGFNIEYSGMKWGMFMVSEFLHAFTAGILSATLFFGGWHGPGAEAYPILGIFYLGFKSFILAYLIMLIRTTFPRVRIDQMLNINWKFLTPLMLVVLMATAIVEQFVGDAPTLTRVLTHLGVNLVLGWISLEFLRDFSRRHRNKVQVVGEPRPEARPPVQPAE